MSEFKVGDKVTYEFEGRVKDTFVVETIDGVWLHGRDGHVSTRATHVRPWRQGDDEAAQHPADIETCALFHAWDRLSAEEAAQVAAIVRRYTAKSDQNA